MRNSHLLNLKSFLFFILFNLISINIQAAKNISLSNGETLQLIGIGMHQELRNDIYIGALYGPDGVDDVEQLKSEHVTSRMSLRFMSSYSHRKLARHWKEKMAMNNARSQWQPLTNEIVEFSQLFMRNMQAGDELNLDYIPGQGTNVYLNSTLFKTIENPAFFVTALNVWLGNIPPTKAFKTSIRGLDSETRKQTYIEQYDSLKPVNGRFDDDLVILNAPVVAAAAVSAAAIVSATTSPIKIKKKSSKKSTKTAKKATKKPPAKKKQSTKKAQKKATPSKTTPKSSKKTKIADKPKTELKKPPAKKVAQVTKKKTPVKIAKTKPKRKDLFDADLIAGSYARDLINAIRQHQKYPVKAIRANEQGDVTAKVTIDSNGELLNISLVEKSGSRILDRAAKKIINKTAPFQAIPKELKLKTYEFEVPMSFKL